jgi:hypothetical protein
MVLDHRPVLVGGNHGCRDDFLSLSARAMVESNKLACRSPEATSSIDHVPSPKISRTKLNQGARTNIKTIITATMKRRALKPKAKTTNGSQAKPVSP